MMGETLVSGLLHNSRSRWLCREVRGLRKGWSRERALPLASLLCRERSAHLRARMRGGAALLLNRHLREC